jgi:hypothetical protein
MEQGSACFCVCLLSKSIGPSDYGPLVSNGFELLKLRYPNKSFYASVEAGLLFSSTLSEEHLEDPQPDGNVRTFLPSCLSTMVKTACFVQHLLKHEYLLSRTFAIPTEGGQFCQDRSSFSSALNLSCRCPESIFRAIPMYAAEPTLKSIHTDSFWGCSRAYNRNPLRLQILRNSLGIQDGQSPILSMGARLVAGGGAGVTAASLTYPLDLVRTRLAAQVSPAPSQTASY